MSHENDDWLLAKTGKSRLWWLALVEKTIPEHSEPSEVPGHDRTDSAAVVKVIAERAMECAPDDDTTYDENMYLATVVSFVLASWAVRVRSAKAFDPNRPVDRRRKAYEATNRFVGALTASMSDCRDDTQIWPGQDWENPFGPDPTDGDFV